MMNNIKINESEEELSYFEPRVCVIGPGGVASDLARLFSAKYQTILFDTDRAHQHDIEKIRHCNFYVVVVPPQEEPPLMQVCEILGKVISGGNIVVCENTLNTAVNEEACISLIEKISGLTCHNDFFAGCSPGWSNVPNQLQSVGEIIEQRFRTTPEIGKIVHEIYSAVMAPGGEIAS